MSGYTLKNHGNPRLIPFQIHLGADLSRRLYQQPFIFDAPQFDPAAVGNHIGTVASMNIHKFNALGTLQGAGQLHHENAFFAVDYREFRIRGKANLGLACYGQIMMHAIPAAFFIAAQDYADAALRLPAGIPQSGHSIERCHGRSLIIDSAPPKQLAIDDFPAKGINTPALAGGNNIQVAQDS